MQSRREFFESLATAVGAYYIYKSAFLTRAFASILSAHMEEWLRGIVELARDLRAETLSVTQWQKQIEALHASIPLKDICDFIDFERLVKGLHLPKDLGAVEDVNFPKVEGVPEKLDFGHKIFVYAKGAATPPHAHNNLVSAHLILRGKLRTRTFDRLQDESKAIWMIPSADREVGTGETLSMSDEQDNIHWFVGATEGAASFDIPIPQVNLKKVYTLKANGYGMIFVDPTVRPQNGIIRAPVMSFADSKKKFGGRWILERGGRWR